MFGSRIAENNPVGHAKYLQHLLERLANLELATRPSGGDATARDKDLRAQEALRLAGQLAKVVAGWAINHQVGLAFAGLENLPPQIGGLTPRAKRDYDSRKTIVDQHSHECGGDKIEVDQEDPLFSRRCLRLLMQGDRTAIPDWLTETTLKGLRALDYGDDPGPLFSKNADGRKLPERVRQYQLRALAFIEYRKQAFGITKIRLEGDIAEALGVSTDTLKDWRKDLPEIFGEYEVQAQLAEARNKGSAFNPKSIKKAGLPAGELKILQMLGDASFGDSALFYLANQYRAATHKPLLDKSGG